MRNPPIDQGCGVVEAGAATVKEGGLFGNVLKADAMRVVIAVPDRKNSLFAIGPFVVAADETKEQLDRSSIIGFRTAWTPDDSQRCEGLLSQKKKNTKQACASGSSCRQEAHANLHMCQSW